MEALLILGGVVVFLCAWVWLAVASRAMSVGLFVVALVVLILGYNVLVIQKLYCVVKTTQLFVRRFFVIIPMVYCIEISCNCPLHNYFNMSPRLMWLCVWVAFRVRVFLLLENANHLMILGGRV